MQLFVNDLTVIDFSYCCSKRGIVGESWIVDVLLDGRLNEMSMVLDFAVIKKQIKAIIDDAVDHKLLVPLLNDDIEINDSVTRNHQYLDFTSKRGSYFLQSPKQAFAKLATKEITINSVIDYLTTVILAQLPSNVQELTLNLRPEVIDGAYYHYTHGLKLHNGNCQRIAHGHRSKIHIYKNEKRNEKLEQQWSERWQDIYLASEADRVLFTELALSDKAKKMINSQNDNIHRDVQHHYFSYYAPQGRFDIAVPTAVLDVVDCDSTVELLADFIVRQLKKQYPNDAIKVVAFEGVAKGAIANG